ncbi:MAG: TetR/AcrR family transcriptional regulator [Pseudomonadota bacterium]
MPPATDPKPALLAALADYVLKNGLNSASLRPMAKAAGTSDRMLIYHFGSKDELITEVTWRLAADLADKLDDALPPTRAETEAACVRDIVRLLRTPTFQPYMMVWLDIVSAAIQGNANHSAAGAAMIDGYLDWLEQRLPETTKNKPVRAKALMTLIEGVVVMDAVGRSAVADAAIDEWFASG